MSKKLIAMAATILFVGVTILSGGVGFGAPMPDPTASSSSSAATATPKASVPPSTTGEGTASDSLLPPTSKDPSLRPSTADATVNIPDAKLKAKLKELTGVGSAAIKRSDLAMLTGGLNLAGLGIAKVEGLQYCENISAISLMNNKVADLPSSLNKLKKITYLNLEDNSFKKIPDVVYSLTTLKHFTIKSNKATKVGDKIGQLINLESLDLSGNEFDDVASNISKLTKLTTLDLSGNNLRKVPRDIFILPLLESLDLSDNVLKELPDAAAAAPKLVTLNVEDNILDKLPSGIGGAPSLLKVYAAINRLTIIEPSLLNGKVTDLTLDVNRITELPTALTGKKFDKFSIEWNFIEMSEGSEARKIADTVIAGSTKAYLRQLLALPAPEFKETSTTVYLQWPLMNEGQDGDSSWKVSKYQIYIDNNGTWGNPIAELDRMANRYVATGLKAEKAYKFQVGVEYQLTLNGRKVTHRIFTPVEVKTLSASATAEPTIEPTVEPEETALATDLPVPTEPSATGKPGSGSGGGSKTALVILIIVGAVVVLAAGLFVAMSMARRGRRNY